MKKSTKTMIEGTVCYASQMILTCAGSFVGGQWAGRAKTTIGKIVRLCGVSALCFGSSYLAQKGVEKLVDEYED